MRIVFIGCVEFSHSTIQAVLALDDAEVVGVVTRKTSSFHSDFRSLESVAVNRGIPCFIATGNDQEKMASWIRQRAPDVIYCFGWSFLLRREILSLPRLGVVGYHPTALPRNRGRHPIVWTLALGLAETASTFFFMDEGADSGDILSQVPVTIAPSDDAASLYATLTSTAIEQIRAFTRELQKGDFQRHPQDHAHANTWRKRGTLDGRIDWRMSAWSIHNLIRALARPYPGAHCLHAGAEIRIWKADIAAAADHHEPGKVLAAGADGIVVKCGEGAIRLEEHEFGTSLVQGSYL